MMRALDNGFQEAVAIVSDASATADRLCRVLGYGRLWEGAPARESLDLLGVPADWQAQEVLIGDADQGRGYIRLLAFPGRDTGVMRDGAQPWDTGGIFDINIRALRSIETLYRGMTQAGFAGFAPITAWDFGPVSVKEVVSRDGDGVCIAFMERVAPPLQGFEAVTGPASYVFNSTQVVADFDAARTFYTEVMGWKPVQESQWAHEAGFNCMGLPLDVARTRQIRVGIYHPHGRMEGSLEIIAFEGEGLDFANASPPDRGWASLRFPVRDVDGVVGRAAAAGCAVQPRRSFLLAPYGEVEAAGLVTPWGARLEAFRAL